jgi:tripartite-type tricarboxylate transporter receptor subunit TctC
MRKEAMPLNLVKSLAVMAVLVLSSHAASPQTGTIKIIVPSTPGGGADILARVLAEQISRTEGVTMVVENRPGAGNTIGTEAASRAAPDGTTLLINTPEFVINAHLRKLSYDPLTSFDPICYLVRSPQLLVVNSAAPYRKLADLLDAARAKPGELTLASTGPASSPHIAIETLKRAAGVNITYVPYQGSTPAVNALLGEHLTAVVASYPNVAEQIRSGKLRALAVLSRARIEQMPEVQTIVEAGFKDLDADIWFGVVAPAKTSNEIIARESRWFRAALDVPEIKSKLVAQGLFAVGSCGSEFGSFIRKQHDDVGRAITEANIKVQ